jgi:CRISPR-associated endonuclease Csn1
MKNTNQNLDLAFDVGHDSIGWSVLSLANEAPDIMGCGAVIFQKDGCLAVKRRGYRRQRRHIRATRQRIARIKTLLGSSGVLDEETLNGVSSSSPWFLAASVLATGRKLSWPELWDVLRWYAHNRGYDGNRAWATNDMPEDEDDTQKVENAKGLYGKHGTRTMAETLCAELGIDPLGEKASSRIRFKGLDAAFPREDVTAEIRRILEAHKGVLPRVDDLLIRALIGKDHDDHEAWKAIPVEGLNIPLRYRGSLLMGQLIPRFENRIISRCPVLYQRILQMRLDEGWVREEAEIDAEKGAKVPAKSAVEFLRFRWAMVLANILVSEPGGKARPLSVEERVAMDQKMRVAGSMTATEFKKALIEVVGPLKSNTEAMLTHPDADKALVLDVAMKEVRKGAFGIIWDHLDDQTKKRTLGRLRHGKTIGLADLVAGNQKAKEALEQHVSKALMSKGKGSKVGKPPTTLEGLLSESIVVKPLQGRAPFSREVMREAVSDIMDKGIHPTAEGGVLYRGEEIRKAQIGRKLDDQTNNHLVRHRLLILERLHNDIIESYADGDPGRIGRITIEVNSELRAMSGRTAKEIAQEEGKKLADFKDVTKELEKRLEGTGVTISAGLIRKARIAKDQGWRCPYTGKDFDEMDLVRRKVDKDHVIPRSLRPSDSLDSLVITFSEVNRMKGQRTSLGFIEEFGGKPVDGRPELTIMSPASYQEAVKKLDERKGHDDDKRRKKNRKRLLLMRDYVEKEFTPGDLTRTSQLVRLGAQLLERPYMEQEKRPVITSLPGIVTGAVRKSWRVLGCLQRANPLVTDGMTKTDVRSVTHLHHALDASVLALASHFLPRDGGIWELLVKRKLSHSEQEHLLKKGRQFARDSEGRISLIDLPSYLKNQLGERLAEKRVVQHIPADMSGLAAEETVYRVFDPKDTHPSAKRIAKWSAARGIEIPDPKDEEVLLVSRKRRAEQESGEVLHETPTWRWIYKIEKRSKLLGLEPANGSSGKLKAQKAVKIIGENFGLALDPEPEVLQLSSVWKRLAELRKQCGRKIRVLRNGDLITFTSPDTPEKRKGIWRISSVQNAEKGIKIDLFRPDQLVRSKESWREVPIGKLHEYQGKIIKPKLTGI